MNVETRVGLFILGAISIFLYLSINIKSIRFDKSKYHEYITYFDETGGLTIKAPVRIAGVEVGWVDSIQLLSRGKAEVRLRVHQQNKLAKNAYATIYQAGLIGTKSLEIDPGNPATGLLLPGSTLSMPGKTPASVGELLDQFRDIASGIQDITNSIKSTVASRSGEESIKSTLESVALASSRMADFAEVLLKTVHKNEENINTALTDMKETVQILKIGIPRAVDTVHDSFENFGKASTEAKSTFKGAGEVVDKINTGKGLVGKLINEDETYNDIRKTIGGVKEYVAKTQALMLNIDMHSETMLRRSNSKGYFELKLRPNSDFFYLIQLIGDEKGSVSRDVEFYTRRDDKGTVLRASELDIPLNRKIEFADQVEREVQKKNDVLFGLQFGKRFNRLALRVGIFENSVGAGIDFYVPLKTDWFHWITTLEAFDFRGTNRIDYYKGVGHIDSSEDINRVGDRRPHVKWLNRAFFLRNIYTTFGIDDLYSRRNANPFFGGGLRFNDDDLKYFLSMLPMGKSQSK